MTKSKSLTSYPLNQNLALMRELDDPWYNFDNSMSTIFDTIFNKSGLSVQTYPPSNTIQTENGFLIEMALAGFKRDDLSVTQKDNILTIEAKKVDQTMEDGEEPQKFKYITKGISSKAFSKSYRLSKTAKVNSVKFEDGMLSVEIEEEKPKEPERIEYKIE